MRACNNHSPSTGDVCRFLHPCSAGSCNATSLQPFNPSIRTPVGHNATRNKLDKSASVLKPPFYMKIGIFLFFYHDGLPCAVLRAAAGAGPQGCAYSDGQSCWTGAMELVQGPGVCATRLRSWALFYCKRGLVSSHGLNAYFLLVCVRSDPGGTISSSLCDMGGRWECSLGSAQRWCWLGGWKASGLLAQNEECRSPQRCKALLLALSSSTPTLLLNLEIAAWGCGLSWLAATCHLPKCLS